MAAASMDLQACISNGQRELARIRLRLSVALILIGITFAVLSVALEGFWTTAETCRTAGELWLRRLLLDVCVYSRIIIPCLAPLADDVCVMRIVLMVDWVLVTIWHLADLVGVQGWASEDRCALYAFVACDVVFVLGATWAMTYKTGPPMHKALWRTVQLWVVLQIPVATVLAINKSAACGRPTNDWCDLLVLVAVLVFVLCTRVQHSIRRSLARVFERRSAQRAAASVAGLVGDCTAKEVLAQAGDRFRSVLLSDLQFEDVQDNTPNPDLFCKTVQTRLGQCDAFVSHSWHDESAAKWAVWQEWRCDFLLSEGKEPNVWLDKCCIDQTNIERDLRCLPVFLSGCRRMVVFCGPTYLSRLWCIMELFTFVNIGGKIRNIQFVPVLRSDREAEDLRSICEAFDTFDARACTCFLQEDKARMLNIIHAAYEDVDDFNEEVRAIFRAAHWWDRLRVAPRGSYSPLGARPAAQSESSESVGSSEGEEESSECDAV